MIAANPSKTSLGPFLSVFSPDRKKTPQSTKSTKRIFYNLALLLPALSVFCQDLWAIHYKVSPPQVSFSGDIKAVTYFASQSPENRSGMGLGWGVLASGALEVKAEGVARTFKYSGFGTINFDPNPGNFGVQNQIESVAIKIDYPWITIIIGNNSPANDMIAGGTELILGASGGHNGTFSMVVNSATGAPVGDYQIADGGNASGISIFSPDNLGGFKIGFTIIPNTTLRGFGFPSDNMAMNNVNFNRYNAGLRLNTAFYDREPNQSYSPALSDPGFPAFDINQMSGGISYNVGRDDCWHSSVALTGIMARSSRSHGDVDIALQDGAGGPPKADMDLYPTRSWQFGYTLGYKDLEGGFTFTENGKSRVAKKFARIYKGVFDAGRVWSVGLAYSFGKMRASVGYASGRRRFGPGNSATAKTVSFALDYYVVKGFRISAEFVSSNMKTCDRALAIASRTFTNFEAHNTKPKVFMLTAQVSF